MGAIYRMPAVIVEDLKATLGKMKGVGFIHMPRIWMTAVL